MIGVLAAFLSIALARASHALAMGRAASRQRRQRTLGRDGIVVGAEGFTLPGSTGRSLLLLHGSGDSPQSLRYLAERVRDAGYTVHVPLLPGHGRAVSTFTRVTERAYSRAADAALDELLRETRRAGDPIVVGGLSMGGALAARLAADRPEVGALVLLAPYLDAPTHVRWVARTSRLWGLAVPFVAGRGDRSVHDPAAAAEGLAYGVFTAAGLRALMDSADRGRRALARVTVPTLVVFSREDNRIPAAIAERSTATLRAHTERHWVAGCGHVITVDYCRDRVADLVIDFLGRHGR